MRYQREWLWSQNKDVERVSKKEEELILDKGNKNEGDGEQREQMGGRGRKTLGKWGEAKKIGRGSERPA